MLYMWSNGIKEDKEKAPEGTCREQRAASLS